MVPQGWTIYLLDFPFIVAKCDNLQDEVYSTCSFHSLCENLIGLSSNLVPRLLPVFQCDAQHVCSIKKLGGDWGRGYLF